MPRQESITPAAPPPPGVTPDLTHPEDVLYTINLVTQIVAMILVTPFVALRIYVKVYMSPPFLVEDYICVLAWVLATAYSTTALVMYAYGGGYHVWELDAERYEGFLKALYADTLVYGLNAYLTKVALLIVIVRVFHAFHKTRIVTFALIAAMALYYVPMFFLKANVCQPISGFWAPAPSSTFESSISISSSGNSSSISNSISNNSSSNNNGSSSNNGKNNTTCLNQRSMFVADTIISVITDTAVLTIPIPAAMSLRMPLQRRLKVWSMLGLGGMATGASIVRLIVVLASIRGSEDQTVDFVRFNLLGTAEVSIGLICACLPAFNICFSRAIESQQSSAECSGGGGNISPGILKFLRGSRLQTATDLTVGTQLEQIGENLTASPGRGV